MPSASTSSRHPAEDPDDRRIRQIVDVYLRGHPPIPGYDAADLYQEGRIAWLLAREGYRPDRRASRATYISRVVEHPLIDLERYARARRRWVPGLLSLERSHDEEDAPARFLSDGGPLPQDHAEARELGAALQRVCSRITSRQQNVLRALIEDPSRSRVELAQSLGVSRDTLYGDIRSIRDACRDHGLEEFLR